MTRLLLLSQWFEPEPTLKGLAFAKELAARGFEVEVLTGFPNYPGGAVYSGYRIKLIQREVIDGIRVTRVPLFPSHSRSKLGRVANYLSFAASSTVYGLFFAKRPDLVYAYHPPLTVGLAASMLKLFRRIPFVYDIQDLWPDTLKATGMVGSPLVLNVVSIVCDFVYSQAHSIVVLSPGFKAILMERGLPAEKISVIYNWCDEAALAQNAVAPSAIECMAHGFTLLFAGNIGYAQGLSSVLKAAEILQMKKAAVQIVFLGEGIALADLKTKARDANLDNVHFLPKVPMSHVGQYLAAASALLIHLRNDPLFEITIPSKTQAYMAVGKPLLMAVKGDAADLVLRSDCGVLAFPEDPDSLADAIQAMASMPPTELKRMGDNAARFYKEHLSTRAGCDAFARTLRHASGAK